MTSLIRLLLAADLKQHVFSVRDVPDEPWLLVFSNLSSSAAHFAIVTVVLLAIAKRKDTFFRTPALVFALYIGFRGMTQLLTIWTIWHPQYQTSGWIRTTMNVLSVTTAVVLVRFLPALRRLPSTADLERAIEQRRQAEEASREKEERYQALLEAAPDAILISDQVGLLRFINGQGEKLFGYAREEILGTSIDLLVPADKQELQREHRRQLFLDPVAAATHAPDEMFGMRKDGSQFSVEFSLSPLDAKEGRLFLFAVRDVTERKKSETRFRSLLESAPDAMVIVNREGLIELANRRTEQLFGYSSQELVGNSVDSLVPHSIRHHHGGHRERFFASPEPRSMGAGLDLEAVRKDGSSFPVEISLSPLEGPNGLSVTAAIRDVTERKLVAQQLADKMTELRQSNEALEQFAHIASHDLQEPLRMVASYTQLLAKRYKGRLDADADEFIDFAVDGTRRMKALIEDLLLYSRAGNAALPVQETSSDLCLQQALNNLFAAIHESQAEVTFGQLPTVTTVNTQLVQIFQNLVGNAIKYRGEKKPEIHVSAKEADNEWIFEVRDNGIGIEAKYFDRIFVIFQRLHGGQEYSGTGIGLAICRRNLQQQGGRIWLESELGRGSTFYFSLPKR